MIFPFFKKKERKTDLPRLKVDLHSHMVPGIDDGSQSMEESLTLLKGMEALGYEKIITTPHVMLDVYRNNREIIMGGLKNVREAARKEGISLQIEAAAEYYLDDGFFDLLEKGNMLTIADEYLLFETSYVAKPMQMEEMIFGISTSGYQPLLAHPERYRYVKDQKKEYGRLKDLGVMFQVNLNSFAGHYGRQAKENIEFLSKHGMIDFLGSDVHHIKQIKTLGNVLLSDAYEKIFENNTILNEQLR